MIATIRPIRPHPAFDAALNLLWPGLAQLRQRRPVIAAYLTLETLGLIALFKLVPTARVPAGIGLFAVAVWAIADAYLVANKRRSRHDAPAS